MILRPALIRYSIEGNILSYWVDLGEDQERLASVQLSDDAVEQLSNTSPFDLVRLLMTPHGHIRLISYFATVCADIVKNGSVDESQLEALKLLLPEAQTALGSYGDE